MTSSQLKSIFTTFSRFQAPELAAIFKDGVLGNYEIANPEPRSGPGENGEGVSLAPSEKAEGDRSVREFGFNMVASDKISLDRRIKDTRPAECKYWHYPSVEKLPTASVVLVFVNEGWSTLIRTVHSVINTSPPELLAEVILVDDYSNKGDHLSILDHKFIFLQLDLTKLSILSFEQLISRKSSKTTSNASTAKSSSTEPISAKVSSVPE